VNLTTNQIAVIFGGGLVALLIVLVLTGVLPGLRTSDSDPTKVEISLNWWTINDNQGSLTPVIQAFNTKYPNAKVNVKTFSDFVSYDRALLDALAAGEGPDIFTIQNTDLPRMLNKVVAAPETFNLAKIRETYPQIVEQDFVQQNKLFAAPYSIDTLALFYNRDLLDQTVSPTPKDWEEFLSVNKKITRTEGNKITLSGAAIGGSKESIKEAADILSALMIQTGTEMTSTDFTTAKFNSDQGRNALRFYTQFATPKTENYSWNDSLGQAVDLFAQEKVGMFVGYSKNIEEIKKRNQFLNFSITDLPQLKNTTKTANYGSYFGHAVSRQSRQPNFAWELLLGGTSAGVNQMYAQTSKKPPAVRGAVVGFAEDLELGVFARQILIARSWPQKDAEAVQNIFSEVIKSVITGENTIEKSLRDAQNKVTEIMQK
jgi:ABC-type glycerol-3-phosphate transport system substrate-binding protein